MQRLWSSSRLPLAVALVLIACITGCGDYPSQTGSGPGRRPQNLALTPNQELAIGRQAFAEIKRELPIVEGGPLPAKVRDVGNKIVKASKIEPLQREINLRMKGYTFEWDYAVFEKDQINAFCLPGGKVGVFTGLLKGVSQNDDQLAAVMAHEIAHALAHHASERLARYHRFAEATDEAYLDRLSPDVVQILAPGVKLSALGEGLSGLAHDRQQESEADHIGLFLMTFAGYDPEQAVVFWERMQQATRGGGRMPEILSDHPSNARRIAQLRAWVPNARAAKKAFDDGKITR